MPIKSALFLLFNLITTPAISAFQRLAPPPSVIAPFTTTRQGGERLSNYYGSAGTLGSKPLSPLGTTTRLYNSIAITTALTALDSFWQNFPYVAAALICGVKASAADLVAQKRDYRKRAEKEAKALEAKTLREAQKQKQQPQAIAASAAREDVTPIIYNPDYNSEDNEDSVAKDGSVSAIAKKSPADWKRNFAFLVYGSLYQGVTQEFIYNHAYPVWFGSATTIGVVLTKVLFDLLIQTTLVTLPIAYLTKSVIYRYSFKEALRRYWDDINNHGLLKKYFLLWGPVQCLTFSVVPEHWRVTFIACVSFFWLIILSTIASKTSTTTTTATSVSSDGTAAVATATASTEVMIDDECSLEDGLTCNIDG